MVSIHRPLGYGPSTLPLRHSATYFIELNLLSFQCVVDAQTQLSVAVEAERNAVEREMMLQGRVNLLESQMNSLRQERSQLTAALEMERTKLQTIEDGHQRCVYVCVCVCVCV